MAFVEVEEGGCDRHRVERANSTHPQERVLGEADGAVALVQL